MAHDPGRAGNGGVQGLPVLGKAGHIHIADALTGQGEGLGIGIADHCVFVQAGNEGHGDAAVDQLPVRFIGNDVDGMAVLGGTLLQQGAQGLQGGLGIHHAGGIVGGVDDDGLCVGRDAGGHLLQIDLEMGRIRRYNDGPGAVALHKGHIFREEGGHQQNLTLRADGQGFDHRNQGRGRTAGEEQLLRFHRQSEARFQIGGHGGAGVPQAGGHGVAVDLDGIGMADNVQDGGVHRRRGRNAGIAQGIIINIFRAHDGGLLQAVGKQGTDDGRLRPQLITLLIDHWVHSCRNWMEVL